MPGSLTEMTWPEVEAAVDDGPTLALVVAGSTEQHGPGLPLAVDAIRAGELGERLADELDCLLAPPIRPGMSDHHMAFPGTISLGEDTFRAVVRDYCRSLDAHGVDDIALITTHGGNAATLESIAPELDDEFEAHVFVVGSREEFIDVRFSALKKHGVSPERAGKHAGGAETSFLMETTPDLVRREKLAEGFVGTVDSETVIEDGLAAITENGVLGDQTAASRAAGRTLIDDCTAYYAAAIREKLDR
jgi:creatinine amidohydrolase